MAFTSNPERTRLRVQEPDEYIRDNVDDGSPVWRRSPNFSGHGVRSVEHSQGF